MKRMVKSIIFNIWNNRLSILQHMGRLLLTIVICLNLLYTTHLYRLYSYLTQGVDTIIYQQTNIAAGIAKAIYRDLEIYNYIDSKREKDISGILDYIDVKLQYHELAKELEGKTVEHKIMDSVIMIQNISHGSQGSGVTIKWKDSYYVLSVAHLVEKLNDKIILMENGRNICELEVIKINKEQDLALFRPKDHDIIPKIYSELSIGEYVKGTEIYVCGNPAGVEDLLSEGRIVGTGKDYTYFYDHSYFGSSGGGIFTKEGKLLGIISHMRIIDPNSQGIVTTRKPQFLIHGACRLKNIMNFLKDVDNGK